jgi:hypothetical protein
LVTGFKATVGEGEDSTKKGEVGGGEEEEGEDEADFF